MLKGIAIINWHKLIQAPRYPTTRTTHTSRHRERAHPCVQGADATPSLARGSMAHSCVQGACASWLGATPMSDPKNIQFPCIEMSRQSLVYGGHTLSGVWVLTLRHSCGFHVRLSSPACRRRVYKMYHDFTVRGKPLRHPHGAHRQPQNPKLLHHSQNSATIVVDLRWYIVANQKSDTIAPFF